VPPLPPWKPDYRIRVRHGGWICLLSGSRARRALRRALLVFGAALIGVTAIANLKPNTDAIRVIVWSLPSPLIIAGATLPRWHWEDLPSQLTMRFLVRDFLFHIRGWQLLQGRIWWSMIADLSIITGIAAYLYVERSLLNFLRRRWTCRARYPTVSAFRRRPLVPLVWMARLFLTIS
jgi:hypothetical protein